MVFSFATSYMSYRTQNGKVQIKSNRTRPDLFSTDRSNCSASILRCAAVVVVVEPLPLGRTVVVAAPEAALALVPGVAVAVAGRALAAHGAAAVAAAALVTIGAVLLAENSNEYFCFVSEHSSFVCM